MIDLKITESFSDKKTAVNTGLYIIIGLCILIIGGASWFMLSSNSDGNTSSEPDGQNNEYTSPSTSYNENVVTPPILPSQETADTVSDQPYSSESEVVEEKPKAIVFAMPVVGEVIKGHSDTQLQFSKTYGDMRIHQGIDISSKIGTAVSSAADGTVTAIEPNTSIGTVITIDHNNGITIKYASIDNLKFKIGDAVKSGDIIGTVGSIPAECEDKEHIHIEVYKDSKPVDPLKALGLE